MVADLEGFTSPVAYGTSFGDFLSELASMSGGVNSSVFGLDFDGTGGEPIGVVNCGPGNYISGVAYGRIGQIIDSLCFICSNQASKFQNKALRSCIGPVTEFLLDR